MATTTRKLAESRSAAARRAEPPEVAALLRKVDATMLATSVTSHMYDVPLPAHSETERVTPALGAKLKGVSALHTRQRDSLSSVLARFGGADGGAGGTTGSLPPEAATAIMYARDDLRGAPEPFKPVQLGAATLTLEEATMRYGGLAAAPPDAEVRKLEASLRGVEGEAGVVARRTLGLSDAAELRKRPKLRDTVGALMVASAADPVWSSETTRGFAYTPAMAAVVKGRDMTHALKNDDERRYAEERIRFDKMLGGGGGRGGGGGGGKTAAKKK